MVKYNFNISTIAYQQRSTAYFYDRCFFYSGYKFSIKQKRKRVFLVAPRFVCPTTIAILGVNHLSRDVISMSSSNPGLLFYALAFEAIGFFGCQVHLYLQSVGENVSEFFIKFPKRISDFSKFSNLTVGSVLLKALAPLLDPVYTVQASLFTISRHRLGFVIAGARLEALHFIRWLDVVQSLYGLDDMYVSFSFVYNSIFFFLCQQFFDFEKKHTKLRNPVNSWVAALLGFQPRYFSYEKVVSGLSFQIVYSPEEFKVRYLL